jgi:Cft2 family RNA processing exonuclease
MIFKSLCRQAGIGANSYLLQTTSARVLLDAGMHPKEEGQDAIPHYEWLDDESLDSVVITHSHLDHVGTLPVVLQNQPGTKVFLTPETADLSTAMLHNSVNVMQSKRLEMGLTEYPLFHHAELDRMVEQFELRQTERPFALDEAGTVMATFHDAGHVLGSVGVMIEADGKRVFYTGDVNFEPTTLQKGARFPETNVDALIVETTRGAQSRIETYRREDEENAFADAIHEVLCRNGSVLIPVFAMGKTQEVLAMLHRFKSEGRIPMATPVYMGGLSTKMTHVYDRHSEVSRRLLPGFRFMKDMDIEGAGKKRRGPIPMHSGCIYALSSGMMSEKTVSNNFARQGFLENPRNGLFFVGYTDPDSPGGRIRASGDGEKVLLDDNLPAVPLRCQTRSFDFSGHSTRDAIADYIVKVRPRNVFLVHGDADAMEWFQAVLRTRLPGAHVIVPQPGDEHLI